MEPKFYFISGVSSGRHKTEEASDNFAVLLEESYGASDNLEGTVIKGTVINIENDLAIIDVGLKLEGRIPLKEFAAPGQEAGLKIGDTVEVFLERIENSVGEAVLSLDKARREEAWEKLEVAFDASERVEGIIFGRVKGGFTVDLSGAVAFLPGSQVDVRPVRDIAPLMGIPQPFQILKMDRRRGNIVVSRRAVLEESRAEARSELIGTLEEGQTLEGVVKNITDYGAFVDLGGVDGLLHVTDIAWRRVNHPSEALTIGETVKVQVIRLNKETQRISLGMKQLEEDPWESLEAKYPVGSKFTGRVTNITDYGAFVELEAGVEGFVHVSEMSWTKKNVHPGKIVFTSQEVEVMVLEVDQARRRISLSMTANHDEAVSGRKQSKKDIKQYTKPRIEPGEVIKEAISENILPEGAEDNVVAWAISDEDIVVSVNENTKLEELRTKKFDDYIAHFVPWPESKGGFIENVIDLVDQTKAFVQVRISDANETLKMTGDPGGSLFSLDVRSGILNRIDESQFRLFDPNISQHLIQLIENALNEIQNELDGQSLDQEFGQINSEYLNLLLNAALTELATFIRARGKHSVSIFENDRFSYLFRKMLFSKIPVSDHDRQEFLKLLHNGLSSVLPLSPAPWLRLNKVEPDNIIMVIDKDRNIRSHIPERQRDRMVLGFDGT